MKKDGSGLKQAVRYVEQPLTSAKTSHQHFYRLAEFCSNSISIILSEKFSDIFHARVDPSPVGLNGKIIMNEK